MNPANAEGLYVADTKLIAIFREVRRINNLASVVSVGE